MDDQNPYFPRNRDETDIAYARGWDDKAVEIFNQPYQKESLAKAYL